MSESAFIPPSNPFEPKQVDGELNLQRGLIQRGFRYLYDKYQNRVTWSSARRIFLIDSDQDLWNAALSRLQSMTLPSLRQLIDPLQTLLNPSEFRTADGPTLEQIIEIQTGLDDKMDQLASVTASIRYQVSFPVLPPDHDRGKELKAFSCQEVLSKLESLIDNLQSMLYHCFKATDDFRLPPASVAMPTHMPGELYKPLVPPESASESITLALKWLACSELGKIRSKWENKLCNFDFTRSLFLKLIKPTPQEPEDHQINIHAFREDVSRLVELAIRLVRLTRLFHSKMASCVFNMQTFSQAFSEMHSEQLRALTNSPDVIVSNLNNIYAGLRNCEGVYLYASCELIRRSISDMKDCLHSTIISITFYVLPLLNHSLSDNPAPHNPILGWLATWYQLFCNVTIRYRQTVDSLSEDGYLLD